MAKEYEQAIGRKQKASVSGRVQAEHRGSNDGNDVKDQLLVQ